MEAVYKFNTTSSGTRLDRFISQNIEGVSRTQIQKLIEQGKVFVNGVIQKSSYKLEAGDQVELAVPSPEACRLTPESIPLEIVYADHDLLVINKPAGLTVHPAPGHPSHTLVNAVLAINPHLAGGDTSRPGVVHRLDKDTSGLIIVAKNPQAHYKLANQFKNRTVKKSYIALVEGVLAPAEGFIEAPIGRDREHRKRMAIAEARHGRSARTGYRVIEYFNKYTLLEVQLETGRTHQIRVHLAAIGHPIAGDATYGSRSKLVPRQFLHACRLVFCLPSTGKTVKFDSGLPPDLEQALKTIRS